MTEGVDGDYKIMIQKKIPINYLEVKKYHYCMI